MIGFFKKLFSLSDGITEKTEDMLAQKLIDAYGGRENILSVEACITRLRISVRELTEVDQEEIKTLGAKGVIIIENSVQSVFGTHSDRLKNEIKAILGEVKSFEASQVEINNGTPSDRKSEETEYHKVRQWPEELGGIQNIRTAKACAMTRICIETYKPISINKHSLWENGIQAIVQIDSRRYHLLVGLDANHYANALNELIKQEDASWKGNFPS